jgi:hypothetical protein
MDSLLVFLKIFSPYFLSLVLGVSLCKLLGDSIFYAFRIKRENKKTFILFESIFFGCVILVLIYSVVITKFKTVNIGLLPFILCYLLARKKEVPINGVYTENKSINNFFGYFIYLGIPITVFFIWQVYSIYSIRDNVFFPCNADLHTAAHWINDLNESGLERAVFPFTPPGVVSGRIPYRYFEYWFSAFFTNIGALNALLVLKLVQVPAFCVFVYIGCVSFIHCINEKFSLFTLILPYGLIFFSQPLFGSFLTANIFGYDYNLSLNIGASEALLFKTLPLYLVMIFFSNMIIRKKYNEAFFVISILPIINFSTLPSILFGFLGVCLLLFLNFKYFFRSCEISNRSFVFSFASVFLFLIIFYVDNSVKDDFSGVKNLFSFQSILNYYDDLSRLLVLLQFIKSTFAALLESLFVLSSVCLIGYLASHKKLSFVFICFCFFGIVCLLSAYFLYSVFLFNYDNFGFYRVVALPFLNVSLYFLFLYFFFYIQNYFRFLFLIPLVINVSRRLIITYNDLCFNKSILGSKIDLVYYDNVVQRLSGLHSRVGLTIHSERNITDKDFVWGQEYDLAGTQTSALQRVLHEVYYPSMFIDLNFNHVRMFSISRAVELPGVQRVTKFYSYYDYFCKKNRLDSSDISSKIKFKDAVDAKFAVATKWATLPKEFQVMVKDSCINRATGDRFFLFN